MTSYADMTDMWYHCEFTLMVDRIEHERWTIHRVADFMVYFIKYMGMDQARVLCKMLEP